jgi:hypothetical protein
LSFLPFHFKILLLNIISQSLFWQATTPISMISMVIKHEKQYSLPLLKDVRRKLVWWQGFFFVFFQKTI